MGPAGDLSTSNSDVSRLAFLEYLRKSCKERGEKDMIRAIIGTTATKLFARSCRARRQAKRLGCMFSLFLPGTQHS